MKENPSARNAPKPVSIWIRASTEDQAKGESPEHHEKRARSYAEAKGWKVKEVYHLAAVSGKSVWQHAEAKRMLEDVKSGHISGLIFSKLSRLARNARELSEISDLVRKQGADLILLQEAIDTSSPAGRLFYTMHACGYKLASDGQDTRAIQHYLGHKNIQHTAKYTELSAHRFKEFWGD